MDLLDDDTLIDLRRRARPTDPAAVLQEEGRRANLPATNPALRDWQGASPATTPATPPTATPDRTAPPASSKAGDSDNGLCQLCGTRPQRGQCAMCQRHACAADLWVMLRLCRDCASDDAVARGQRGAQPEARNWLEGPR